MARQAYMKQCNLDCLNKMGTVAYLGVERGHRLGDYCHHVYNFTNIPSVETSNIQLNNANYRPLKK